MRPGLTTVGWSDLPGNERRFGYLTLVLQPEQAPDPGNRVTLAEGRDELGSQIEEAISQLRPEYRSCIMLRHVEGCAYEEIAEILDLPLGTVKTYIHRARSELRDLLKQIRE